MELNEALENAMENEDLDQLNQVLDLYTVSNNPIPIDNLLDLYDDTEEDGIKEKILLLFLSRTQEIMPQLISIYKATDIKTLKAFCFSVISSELSADNLLFLIDHFVKTPRYRDDIFALLNKDPENTLLAMTVYVEQTPLTFEEENILIEWLSQMDPKLFYKNTDLSYMKISDLFYSIPPKEKSSSPIK